ncbi:MAG: DUF1697 domain-containing protein [Chitinophagaceae bacterium]|nr:DUF1697 domain-containing protein [Rubrivivax sp.]
MTMPRFVALLRGVNVGAAKRVPMAELRALLATLGHTEVATLLNSGNAVFASSGRSQAGLAGRIRGAIAEMLGVDVPVIVKSAQEVAAIVAANPFVGQATDPSRLLVAFTPDRASLQGLNAVSAWVKPPEQLHVGDHAAYLWCPDGVLKSAAGEALLGKPGRQATTRNWATVLKISTLLIPV